MRPTIKWPVLVEFQDYHEVADFQDTLRAILPGVKVREIGNRRGLYVGIVYYGSLKDRKTAALIRQVRTEIADLDAGVSEQISIGEV